MTPLRIAKPRGDAGTHLSGRGMRRRTMSRTAPSRRSGGGGRAATSQANSTPFTHEPHSL